MMERKADTVMQGKCNRMGWKRIKNTKGDKKKQRGKLREREKGRKKSKEINKWKVKNKNG